MRVISGQYKGKRLESPVGDKIRPTSDRIKETVFNILSAKKSFEGTSILDLFAGSGALGIEALSRGASRAVFVDIDPDSNKLEAKNLKIVGANAEIFNADYRVAIKKLEGRQFDIIFMDAPYTLKIESLALELIQKHDILADGGIIFIEHSKENSLLNISESFIIDTRKCGNTYISFLRISVVEMDENAD